MFYPASIAWLDDLLYQLHRTFIEDGRYKLFLSGLGNTLLITICAGIIGCLLGTGVSVIKVLYAQSREKGVIFRFIHWLCDVYLTVIRGTPIVVQLLIMYFIVFKNLKTAVLIAIITFGINSGAYVAEIVRSGIMAVDPGQMEAGRSLGLSTSKTMIRIVLPQAIKNILPTLCNEFISLLKETSVVGYVTITDFARAGDQVRTQTALPFVSLISVALGYLIIVIFVSSLLRRLERRLRRSDRS